MIKQIFDEQDLPMGDLEKIGLAKDGRPLLDEDDLAALLSGRRTDMLRMENLVSDGLRIPILDAKLSLKQGKDGSPELLVHPIYREALQPSFLTDGEAEKLEKGEAVNLEKMIFDDEGNPKDILIEFDRETNEFIVTDSARILAPDRVNGEYLSLDQKERYRKGKEVELPDGTKLQYSATEKQGIRSNKLALIASIVIDGGLSFMLYKGLHALFGEKQDEEKAAVYSRGYYKDLEIMQQQSRETPLNNRFDREYQQEHYENEMSR
jgi:hypothetical protein